MTRADEIALRFSSLRAKLAENFHPDHYEIVRVENDGVPVADGYGGYIDPEPEVVETGGCRLHLGGQQGTQAVRGGIPTGASSYTAELPIDSVVDEEDTLRINGRTFEIVAPPKRGGNDGLFTICELEERG